MTAMKNLMTVILIALLSFTALSILITSYDLGPLAVSAALLFASLKTTLVLLYFMVNAGDAQDNRFGSNPKAA